MKILVYGPKERYERYRPSSFENKDIHLVFAPFGDSQINAARMNTDAEVIFADPFFEITEEIISLLPNLKLIQSEGVAFNRFDLEAARKRNIYVCNNKGCNASSVAEHTVMLMLMSLRFGITGDAAVRAGHQMAMKEKIMKLDAPELADCTVGLIGFGDIAQAVAKRLSAFGCRLFYYSLHRRQENTEREFNITYLPLEKLVETCDIISLHCAVNDQTRKLVNAELLQHFKQGAILVNTARGDLMENSAVRQALMEGRLGGLAADTLAPEPTPADHPLVDLPKEIQVKTIFSPHLAGNTGSSFRKAHANMWNNVQLILKGERPEFVVNSL